MKVLAFNGSPRKKKWNTVTMLEHTLEGAKSVGAEVELIHLYPLDFKGCASCFACKRHDRKQTGVCVLKDELAPVLEKIRDADALVVGTPVYFGSETACTRTFLERLQFPYLNYQNYADSHFPRRIPTGLIYTMNIPESMIEQMGYESMFERTRSNLERQFGASELVLAMNTTQYDDYDKYETGFDKDEKAQYREAVFGKDCRRAFELGTRLGSGTIETQ
ncbi:flavodoxin family protein [Pseudodesulfovibrio piezophilus]|uniref:NADPH-dependent FMN reductase-like domain-containing protein n=1 Tax=Pseudodesulfovibrio piezophilus (strain DSM 21447 / JCM 15486 / C1TLV30) TaxID=1322246 RepID=M1WNB2_PSEP2|nr:flavodoxin family protein [Pseudodesulfovibrio piezophilus]CCH50265.1 conserved protein of unknown function [Pseudodesulfovibrio piezophilus C1TLV30]